MPIPTNIQTMLDNQWDNIVALGTDGAMSGRLTILGKLWKVRLLKKTIVDNGENKTFYTIDVFER